jgi:LysM repeat protein
VEKTYRSVQARIVLCVSLLVFALILPAMPVSAAQYGNIGGRPANPDPNNERSKSIFVHTIEPTTTASDGVQVINNTGQTKTLLVYATDGIVSSDGAFGCAQLVDEKKGVGTWIKLAESEVTLKSMTSKVVPFTMTPPPSAEVGENDGCIVVQEKNGPVQNVKKPDGGSLAISFRTAIRVAIQIPGDVQKHLRILGYAATPSDDGNYLLKPRVKNDGNVSLDTSITLYVHDLFGGQKYMHQQQYPTLRNATSNWNLPYKKPFWGGWMKSYFTASYDSNIHNGIGDDKEKNMVTLKSEQITFYSAPQPLALLIWLLILAALGYGAYRGYRYYTGKRKQEQEWETIVIDTHIDIVKLAETFGVPWKRIAKANHLKPPYILKPGDKIKVPSKVAAAAVTEVKSVLSKLPKRNRHTYDDWELIILDTQTDIESLAKVYGVPWKQIAKANNLKAPYILRQGETVKVPPQAAPPKPPEPPKPPKSLSSLTGGAVPAHHEPAQHHVAPAPVAPQPAQPVYTPPPAPVTPVPQPVYTPPPVESHTPQQYHAPGHVVAPSPPPPSQPQQPELPAEQPHTPPHHGHSSHTDTNPYEPPPRQPDE